MIGVLRRAQFVAAFALMLMSLTTVGCGPTAEEIRAREQAREQARLQAEARARAAAEAARQAEEARQRAEQARLEALRAAEAAGDQAAQQGDFDTALASYGDLLKKIQRYGDQDQRVRQATIKVARSMATPPALPDNVMRYMVRGEAKVKAGGAGSYEEAAEEMERALLEAPWFADGYFNLGMVQDKAGSFEQAIQNLQMYRFAAPQAQNAAAVQAKIYELEVKQEDAMRTLLLVGTWTNADKPSEEYGVWLEAGKITVGSGYKLERKGRALEGFFDGKPWSEHNCPVPGDRGPATGTISADGTSMELHHEMATYQVRYQGNQCLGVTLVGKEDLKLRLIQKSHCRMCFTMDDLSAEKAATLGLQAGSGVLLTGVLPGGPSDKAGLRQGDVIISYQGKSTPNQKLLSDLIAAAATGTNVRVAYLRAGKQYDTIVKVGLAPDIIAAQPASAPAPPAPAAAPARRKK